MKKLFISLAILTAGLTSCSEPEKIPTLIEKKNPLHGTVWVDGKFSLDQNGAKIYKVWEFTKDDIVKIAYRKEKKELYANVGEFEYITEYPRFWVKNPDNTRVDGYFTSDTEIVISDENLVKQ